MKLPEHKCETIRWYPNTPVCFSMRSASTLEALLASFESEES